MCFSTAILNLNFRHQNSDFNFHQSEFPKLIGILLMGFLAAFLNWNFRRQNLEVRIHQSEFPTELLYFYTDIYIYLFVK